MVVLNSRWSCLVDLIVFVCKVEICTVKLYDQKGINLDLLKMTLFLPRYCKGKKGVVYLSGSIEQGKWKPFLMYLDKQIKPNWQIQNILTFILMQLPSSHVFYQHIYKSEKKKKLTEECTELARKSLFYKLWGQFSIPPWMITYL